jgi:hypothetical protein
MCTHAAALGCAFWLIFATERPPQAVETNVQLEMRNVRLHMDEGIVLDVRRLRGIMTSRSAGTPPIFDDQNSYIIQLQTAQMSMDMTSLQNLMNRYAFAYDGSPLKDLVLAADGTRIRMKGKLHKGVDVPISTTASVSATSDGQMRLHVESMKAVGIPAKGLLGIFGLKLNDVVDIKNRRGIDVQDYDIVISPGQILPPPEIRGKLSKVAVQGHQLVQSFDDPSKGPPARLALSSPNSPNYVYFGGGVIRFGKLTMHDADLQLIDQDPKDPFDFFPARYNAQLVAGYSKNTPKKGLKTYMPDYDDLQRKK